jgi:hypothetical protein
VGVRRNIDSYLSNFSPSIHFATILMLASVPGHLHKWLAFIGTFKEHKGHKGTSNNKIQIHTTNSCGVLPSSRDVLWSSSKHKKKEGKYWDIDFMVQCKLYLPISAPVE